MEAINAGRNVMCEKPFAKDLAQAREMLHAAEKAGGSCILRDLYHLRFDPLMGDHEIPRPKGFEPGADVAAERALVGDADVFVFVYPLWFNSPPAMMKGYMERVFGSGFGYEAGADGARPLLSGRTMVTISSSGAPQARVRDSGAWSALHKLFDEHFAAVCGLTVADHLHFGEITAGITRESVQDCAAQVAAMVDARFYPAP